VSLKLILEDGVFVLIASSNSTQFIEMARAVIWFRVKELKRLLTPVEPCWASPGAKGQQSSAGDSENIIEMMRKKDRVLRLV